MGAGLELLAGVLVDVRGAEEGVDAAAGFFFSRWRWWARLNKERRDEYGETKAGGTKGDDGGGLLEENQAADFTLFRDRLSVQRNQAHPIHKMRSRHVDLRAGGDARHRARPHRASERERKKESRRERALSDQRRWLLRASRELSSLSLAQFPGLEFALNAAIARANV